LTSFISIKNIWRGRNSFPSPNLSDLLW